MLDWPHIKYIKCFIGQDCAARKKTSSSFNFMFAPNGNFPGTFKFDTRGSKVVSVAKFPGNSSTGSYLTPIFMCFHPHIIVKSWFRLYQMKHFQEISKWGGGKHAVYQMKNNILSMGLNSGLIQFIYLIRVLIWS